MELPVRVDLRTYRRLTVVLLGGAALVAAGAAVALADGHTLVGALLGVTAALAVAATFALRIRGDLRGQTILLLTRQECPLCDTAERLLRDWQDEMGYDLWVADVDDAPDDVRETYTARLPVVMHNGEVLLELDVRADALRALLLAI